MFKIYKYKIQSKHCNSLFELHLDKCRELYNAALQERRDAWKLCKVSINNRDQQNQLPAIKGVREDLCVIYAQVLQNALARVDKAFKNFYKIKRAGYPRFKSASRYNSFTYLQAGFKLKNNKLRLSKIGVVKLHLSRSIEGKIKTCTIKRELSGWFVVFTCIVDTLPLLKTKKQIGIDVGIENFATLSNGTQIDNNRYYDLLHYKLRVTQRSLSRKKRRSNNRKKVVYKLARIHEKIRNQRADFQHKLSTQLIRDYDLIAIEKLNVQGMSEGILGKQIRDAGWGNFFNMLRYKAESADRVLVEVNPAYTSQMCSNCGTNIAKSLSIREHSCTCGLRLHRDHNAAINILRLGQSQLALT